MEECEDGRRAAAHFIVLSASAEELQQDLRNVLYFTVIILLPGHRVIRTIFALKSVNNKIYKNTAVITIYAHSTFVFGKRKEWKSKFLVNSTRNSFKNPRIPSFHSLHERPMHALDLIRSEAHFSYA